MNQFAKIILMRANETVDKERRDMRGREDYARGRRRDRGHYDYDMEDYARRGRGRDRARGRDRDDYDDYGWSETPDYEEEDYARGRGRGRDRMRGRDMDYMDEYMMRDNYSSGRMGRMDYASDGEYFTEEEIEDWKKSMKNEDGTTGPHFKEEQVKQAAQKAGVTMSKDEEDIFCLCMNMMYSDYCKVAKKYGVDKPEFFAELADAFLNDKDFDGEPEEKLYLYWKAIAEK